MKKAVVFCLVFAMVFGSFSIAFAASGTFAFAEEADNSKKVPFSDIAGHWSERAVSKWTDYGIINGYQGIFQPNAAITRAEMAAVLDRMMGYQVAAVNTFTDVPDNAWYADAILKANAAGILNGDGKGHAFPAEKITREQAASMLARALAVEESNGSRTKFQDASKISSWAEADVFGMEASGFINGADGRLNPQNPLTRAEAVTIIDNAVKAYYNKSGTYTDTVDGLTVIAVKDVVLKNTTINGNLILAEGVGADDAILDNTLVKGNVVVRGGGSNSVRITGNSQINGTIKIQKIGNCVRILAEDGTIISDVEADGPAVLEGNFKNVEIISEVEVEIKGTIENIKVEKEAGGASVTVSAGAKVTNLQVDAPKTKLNIAGTVKTVGIAEAADGTKLNLEKDAAVEKLKSDAKIQTAGEGKITEKAGTGSINNSPIPESASADSRRGSGGSGSGSSGGNVDPVPPTAENHAPAIVSGRETQTGTAVPSASSGNPSVMKYTADVSEWFEDEDAGDSLTYLIVSASEGIYDIRDDVTLNGTIGALEYAPSAEQASKEVVIIVKANDGAADSEGNVTITVSVGAQPSDSVTNYAPTVISGQKAQAGTAKPAADGGNPPAVRYTADASLWFEDSDGDCLTYEMIFAKEEANDVSGDVTINENTGAIEYIPSAAQASSEVVIIVKANDGTSDSTENVTITISVAARQADTDQTAPVPGNTGEITATSVTSNSLTLNWAKATDAVTAQGDLKYYVYQSGSNNISTPETCLANGTLLNSGGTADINTYAVTGLAAATTYYFNIVVEDESGNKAAYDITGKTTLPELTGQPSVTAGAPPTVGTQLTIGTGSLSVTTNLTYTWYRSDDMNYDAETDTQLATGTTYTPVGGDAGKYLVVVAISADAAGEGILVTATKVNSNPAANADTGTVIQNATVLIDVLANDTDQDGDTLSITTFTAITAHGAVTQEGDSLRYNPDDSFAGTDSFTYDVSDGMGGTATGTVTVTVLDQTAPVPQSTAITIDSVGSTSLTLNWAKATDAVTAQGDLKYYVYQSGSNNISTPETCLANGTLLNSGGTADINTYAVTGLTAATTYYFNIVVEDESGNKEAYDITGKTTLPELTGQPSVTSGEPPTVGTQLTIETGSLSVTTNLTYTWYRSDDMNYDAETDTQLATGTTYTPVGGDAGKYLVVVAISADAAGKGILVTGVPVSDAAPVPPAGNLLDAAAGNDFTGVLYTSNGGIYYNRQNASGKWEDEVLIGTGTEGKLAVDCNGKPHIVYTTSGKIGYRMYDGSAWTEEVLIQSNNGGACSKPDIAVDSLGKAHLTYSDTKGNTGSDSYTDIMYANNAAGDFVKAVSFRGYLDYYGGADRYAEYFNKNAYIALDSNDNYYIITHKYQYQTWMGGNDKQYSLVLKSNLGSGGTTTASSDIYDVYALASKVGKVVALYRQTGYKTSELVLSDTTISFSNTVGLTGTSFSSACTDGVDVVTGGLSSANLLTYYNGSSEVYSEITVKSGTGVSIVNIAGTFYAVFTDNVDGVIKKTEITVP